MERPALITIALLATLLVVGACDDLTGSSQAPERAEPEPPPSWDYSDLDDDEIRDFTDLRPGDLRRITTGEAQLFPACRELFEEDGEFLDWPFEPGAHRRALYGCDPEAYLEFGESRAVAYSRAVEGEDRTTNLQVVVYGPDGSVAWHHVMDRTAESRNFTANYRGSFLTALQDRLLCGGTLFQGNTLFFCARQDSGEVVHEGRLDFWAGVRPFAFANGLVSADIRGITLRYPFTGAEMRHRSLPGRGGRAAFYATDEEQIFFAPAEDEPLLTAWDLDTMSKSWEALLPSRPRITFQVTSTDHRLLLLKVGPTILGIDTDDGALRMAFHVGEAFPPVGFSEDTLYLLLRRDDDPALIYALNPDDGEVRWVAMAPSGTLDLTYDDELLVRSVRAVRPVTPAPDDPDDG